MTDDGGLRLTSGAQRFYEGPVAIRFPIPFSGRAHLTEQCDDGRECFVIDLEVRNDILGFLFGYRGTFTCEFIPGDDAPATAKPHPDERSQPDRGDRPGAPWVVPRAAA